MQKLLFVCGLAFLISSCSGNQEDLTKNEADFTPVALKYAKHFELLRSGDQFILHFKDADSGEVTDIIDLSNIKSKRVICHTATLTGMFCELNERNRLIGISAGNELYDSNLKKRYNRGKLKEFGDFTQLSIEQIIAAKPNVILYNYVQHKYPHQEKLERLGVKIIVVNDWLEAHPLAKAEWIKVVGAITGKYDETCALFDTIEANYLATAERMKEKSPKPTVISGNLIGGTWYTPSGENYFGLLIKDAGGDYRYKESKGAQSLALPLEKILEDNQTTEIWLNPGVPNWEQLERMNPRAKLLGASENEIYCYSGQTNKFWEQSAARPDYVLSDLAQIFHPDSASAYQFHYYAPLTK